MIFVKFILMFLAIVSLILLLEQFYLIRLVVKNKGKVNDNGTARLILSIVFSVCTALLVVFWNKM